jgi:hypothetical protein
MCSVKVLSQHLPGGGMKAMKSNAKIKELVPVIW